MESRGQGFSEGRKLEPEVRRECRFPSNLKKSQGRHLTFFLRTQKWGFVPNRCIFQGAE